MQPEDSNTNNKSSNNNSPTRHIPPTNSPPPRLQYRYFRPQPHRVEPPSTHHDNNPVRYGLLLVPTNSHLDYGSVPLISSELADMNDREYENIPSSASTSETFMGRFIRRHGAVYGTILAVMAGLTFTSANVVQKMVPALNFWDLLLVRAFVQCLIMFPILLWKEIPIWGPPGVRSRVVAQGFIGGILLLCIFVAIKHIPLGDASAIFFSAPFFTMIFSTFMLREHFGIYRGTVSVFLVFGIILLCRPPAIFAPNSINNSTSIIHFHDNITTGNHTVDPNDDIDGESFGMVGTCCAWAVPILSAVVSILTRQCKHVHFIVLTFWFGVGALLIAFVGFNIAIHEVDTFSLDFQLLSIEEWAFTLLIVFLGIIGNIIMTIALRHVSPAKAMVFRSFEVILNYVLQLTLFTSVPFHWTDPVGACLITISVIVMGFERFFLRKYTWKYL